MNEALYRRAIAGETLTIPLPGQSLWRLSGPDRERYLNGQVTQDVALLAPGSASLAAVCTAKGRMEGAVVIAAQPDAFYLDAAPGLRDTLGPRLEKYLIADDAQFEDLSDAWTLCHVLGAAAPDAGPGGFVVRHARFGLAGHDVWTPGAAPVFGETVDDDVAEILRIEHAIPRWDAELTPQTLPPEAGPIMLHAISYTKGCYVGQETIARLKSVGHVNRTLVLLHSASAEYPAAGSKIATTEKEVGTITSSGFSPRLDAGIALGYVPPALAVEGTALRAGDIALTVAKPFLVEGAA